MTATSQLRPALFLDRDGVINEEVGYLSRWEDCRFVGGIVPLLRAANRCGYVTVVITNQSGIARGLYTEEDFHRLMNAMTEALAAEGALIDAVYFSPFHPQHGVGQYKRESDCRKPAPGMLLRAAREHGLSLKDSILVGDRCSDLAAGHAAGVPRLFLLQGTEVTPCGGAITYTVLNELFTLATQMGEASPPGSAGRPAGIQGI